MISRIIWICLILVYATAQTVEKEDDIKQLVQELHEINFKMDTKLSEQMKDFLHAVNMVQQEMDANFEAIFQKQQKDFKEFSDDIKNELARQITKNENWKRDINLELEKQDTQRQTELKELREENKNDMEQQRILAEIMQKELKNELELIKVKTMELKNHSDILKENVTNQLTHIMTEQNQNLQLEFKQIKDALKVELENHKNHNENLQNDYKTLAKELQNHTVGIVEKQSNLLHGEVQKCTEPVKFDDLLKEFKQELKVDLIEEFQSLQSVGKSADAECKLVSENLQKSIGLMFENQRTNIVTDLKPTPHRHRFFHRHQHQPHNHGTFSAHPQ